MLWAKSERKRLCVITVLCFPPHVFFDGLTGLYLPYHLPFLISFSLLNLYLHCGYRISVLEWVLPRLFVNTSEWHNKHHELSVSHFGEMLTLWDHTVGTHTGHWSKKKYESQMKKIVMGQSGMDEQMH